jgi:signal transduction histidine kinase/CheY-like chemotaxis protein
MGLRRWLALLVAGTLVPLLVFSAATVYQYAREQNAAAEQALQDAARVLVVALDKHHEATITALRVLGTSERLDAGDLKTFHQQCLRALEVRAEWRTISLFDPQGRRLLITSEPVGTALPPPPAAMSEPFRRLVESRTPNVSDLFASPLTKRLGVSIGVPVLRAGEVRWVLSAGMTPEAVARLLAGQRVLPEWTGVVLDRRHVIVAHSRLSHLAGTPAPPAFVEAVTARPDGTVRDGAAEGVSAMTAFSRSPAFGWTAAISVPAAGGAFGRPVRTILAAGVVLLLVGVFVALWTGRRISRPIEALASAAQRLGRGEAVEAVPSRVAEVAMLSTALAGAARDRARAAAEIAGYAERLEILHEIDRAVIAAEAPAAVAEAALRRLRPLLGTPRAVVTVFDLAAGEGEWLAVNADTPSAVGAGARFPLAMMGDLDALRRGELQVIDDVAALGHIPQAQALMAEGIRSYLVVPLVAGGELVGSLNFGGPTPGRFPAAQVDIAREVAAQIAIAISQARLHDRVKRHAEELEGRVAERTDAANRANQAKSEFLSRMSHELRTPLNAVLGFAQLLELGRLDERQRESVVRILAAGRHLLGLINEVLEISRIEAGRLHLTLEPLPVAEVVRSAIDLVRPLAAARGIALRMDEPLDRRHVQADRQRLQQVLLNLLSNGVKYNREGGQVTVACAPATGPVEIRVTDTGRGIAAEDLARLFTPFERLGAESGTVEGTGLGLAVSRQLAEAMSGAIRVDSTPGVGSTFTLELPVAAAPEASPGAPPPPAAGAPDGIAGVVLYIEDNLANVQLVERVVDLRPRARLLSAMQGLLGLDLAREHRPDLILLDLHLPDVSGEDVLRRLGDDPRTRDIPVVVLSADATPREIERLRATGARAYLTKPFDVRELLALLDEHLGAAGAPPTA